MGGVVGEEQPWAEWLVLDDGERGVVEVEAVAAFTTKLEELAKEGIEDRTMRDDEHRALVFPFPQPAKSAARPFGEIIGTLGAGRHEVTAILHPLRIFLGIHLLDFGHDPPLEDAELNFTQQGCEREWHIGMMPHNGTGGVRRAGKVGGVAGVELVRAQPHSDPLRLLPPTLGEGRVLLPLDAPLRVVCTLPMPHEQEAHTTCLSIKKVQPPRRQGRQEGKRRTNFYLSSSRFLGVLGVLAVRYSPLRRLDRHFVDRDRLSRLGAGAVATGQKRDFDHAVHDINTLGHFTEDVVLLRQATA